MSIARSLVNVLPSFSKSVNITEAHSVKNNSNEIRTLMFNDLSLLRINENEDKGYVAETKFIEAVNFGGIKKRKMLFGEKKQLFTDIITSGSVSDDSDLSFVKIKIADNNRIELGLDSIYLTSDKDCFSLSLTGTSIKSMKKEDAESIFSVLNVDSSQLITFLKEKNDLLEQKRNYSYNQDSVMELLKDKQIVKEKEKKKPKQFFGRKIS